MKTAKIGLELPSMEGKTVVITGASSGIGKVTALELANLGANVIMVCRNATKAETTRKEIVQATGNNNITLILADLALMREVERAATEINSRFPKLDILINNAGIMPGKRKVTAEGHEIAWATNYLAPFLLTNLLTEKLMAAEKARIINVSSEAHRLGQLNFQDMHSPKKYSALTAYSDSKLANILFTYELARRLELTDITVNCLHPGVVATNFANENGGSFKYLFLLGKPFMTSPEKGARTTVYLAASPEAEKFTGTYFKNLKPARSAKQTYSPIIARRLWDLSEKQTGFSF